MGGSELVAGRRVVGVDGEDRLKVGNGRLSVEDGKFGKGSSVVGLDGLRVQLDGLGCNRTGQSVARAQTLLNKDEHALASEMAPPNSSSFILDIARFDHCGRRKQ